MRSRSVPSPSLARPRTLSRALTSAFSRVSGPFAGLVLALGAAGGVFGEPASAQTATRMVASPAVSPDHIAFVYDGDLWIAERDGSDPRRLTTHPGTESNPRFSPDGTRLAFSGGTTAIWTYSWCR